MMMSLDALVQNGKGGPQSLVLRQLYDLYVKLEGTEKQDSARVFDEVMANAAAGMDPEAMEALAPAVQAVAEKLPVLAAAVAARVRETAIEQPVASLVQERRTRPRDPVQDAQNPITLARRASAAELLQIAALPNLPDTVTGVILERGDRAALQRALTNPTAAFSKSSLTTLAELAPSDRMIKDAMLCRHDLPEPIIERLLPFLSIEAKAAVLMAGGSFSAEEARESLLQAFADQEDGEHGGQASNSLESGLAGLADGSMTSDEFITLLARDARMPELAQFAAERLAIRQVTAFNILSGRLDHSAAILLRALDCGEQTLDVVMSMRRRFSCREARETRSTYLASQRYTVDAAVAMLKLMDKSGSADPVETLQIAA